MKYLLTSIFLIITYSFSYGQNCTKIQLTEPGDLQVIIQGPETGECFKFYMGKELITPEFTNELTFSIVANDYKVNDTLIQFKGKLIMADGGEVKKYINMPVGYKSHLFVVKKKKAGKYKLKRKFSGMVPTEETLAEREVDKQAFFDEHNRKVEEAKKKREADQAATDAEREEKRKAMKERIKESDGAQLSDYEDTAKGKEGANHKGVKGANHQGVQGANYEGKQGANYEGKQGATYQQVGSNDQNENDTFGSQDSFGKSAFDEEEENEGEAPVLLNPKGETVELSLKLLYDGTPLENTHLTLEINDIILGSGTTNKEGLLTITTNKPVDMYKAFRLTGKKGGASWMFGGIQLLDFPPKTTTVDMAVIIKIVSEQMGISAETLSSKWGF